MITILPLDWSFLAPVVLGSGCSQVLVFQSVNISIAVSLRPRFLFAPLLASIFLDLVDRIESRHGSQPLHLRTVGIFLPLR